MSHKIKGRQTPRLNGSLDHFCNFCRAPLTGPERQRATAIGQQECARCGLRRVEQALANKKAGNPPGYLSTQQVADRFGVTPAATRRWFYLNLLSGEKIDNRLWFLEAEVARFTKPALGRHKSTKPVEDLAIAWLTRWQWDQNWTDERMARELGLSTGYWTSLRNRRQRLTKLRAQVRERFPEAFAHEIDVPT